MTTTDTLHGLFHEQARARPDAVAVVDGEAVLTYGELAERADRVTAALAAAGVARGSLVGLRLPRGASAIAAIVGILGHGCAYVPIDPAYPQTRQDYIAHDARLTAFVEEAPAGAAAPDPVVRSVAHPGPPHEIPAGTAYVIYTSGSTGDPKGVMIGHAHVLALLDSCGKEFDLGPDDVWSMFHSTSFDVSVWELWCAFANGGQVVVVPAATAADPRALATLLAAEQVTVLSQVPTVFGHLVAELAGRPVPLPELRYVVLAGEAVNPTAVRQWHDLGLGPRTRVVNMYGITEITVHATFRVLPPGPLVPVRPGSTPVGLPLGHLSVDVVDEDLVPVPAGEPGELLVSGGAVAFGYLGRPELTAARFSVAADGTRRYRSGDLGLRDEAGELHYLRRLDRQVQVRGFRIEPGEIEHAIRQHPLVAEAAVTIEPNGHGEPMVVGHFVCRPGAPLTGTELRAHLAQRLPGHLLPAALRRHDALPVTPNGKVDLARLSQEPSGSAGTGDVP
ncbi:amino acid adenylation domain-containing protein [Streptomyces sp. NPDC088864]|uniref:amino acid adenylation domain-containing protein n=1 Tax=Streptomyces sp. NPDC088864 TaxID=3365910 RepID=UPI0037F4B7CE